MGAGTIDLDGLDPIDVRILGLLSADSRISYADLGREINLTRGAVRDRVQALVERGVIQRFTIAVDLEKLGRTIFAFFEIDVEPSHLTEVAHKLATNRHVHTVNHMTGPTTLHVHASLKDSADLERFLQQSIYSLEGIRMVRSYILLRSFKSRSGIPGVV